MTTRSWIRRLFARTSPIGPKAASRRRRTGRLELEQLEGRVVPSLAVLTVSDAQDDYTPTLANHFMNTSTGEMSLRGAILAANAGQGNSIAFSVPMVSVSTSLPKATVALTIDGSGGGANGVEIQGSFNQSPTGLWLSVGGDTVTNVTVYAFSSVQIDCQGNGSTIENDKAGTDSTGTIPIGGGAGIVVQGNSNLIKDNVLSGLSGTALNVNGGKNTIEGNDIGTDVSGTIALGDGTWGVDTQGIKLSGSGNTVGGTAPGDANVISGLRGNFGEGIAILNGSTNLVEGNFIGTDVSGTQLIGNGTMSDLYGYFGIEIIGGGHNTIGGTTPAAANVISGNSADGMYLSSYSPLAESVSNVIEGNFIGTDITGTASGFGNGGSGVDISESSYDTVGGTTNAAANVISGNGVNTNQTPGGIDGVRIEFSGDHNVVEGNLIGTDIHGTANLGNAGYGVEILTAATGNTIGGQSTADRNIISANLLGGANIDGQRTNNNVVSANYIGVDSSGAMGLGNAGVGVTIADGASGNTIGGTVSAAANVISSNTSNGVAITGKGTSRNVVEGNLIGTDINGTVALGNGATGSGVLVVASASSNTIGGTSAGARNVISANAGGGVVIRAGSGSTTTADVVDGNYIGTDINGTTTLANTGGGVVLDGSASNAKLTSNTIGGTTAGAGNLISGNTGDGVTILGAGATLNVVEGNLIGTDAAGAKPLPNTGNGVTIEAGAFSNTVGGAASRALNVISANGNDGVLIQNSGTIKNLISHNLIGLDVLGSTALGNSANGVAITSGAASNTIGGSATGAGNIISANAANGIDIDGTGTGTSNNVVGANFIGTDISGTIALANATDGVRIENNATGNTIGGAAASASNVISGNGQDGIVLSAGVSQTLVAGNLIGITKAGVALGNNMNGVTLENGASGNTIGGLTTQAANIISDNGHEGVLIDGSGTSHNVVEGNYIGTTPTSHTGLGNGDNGVEIDNGAASNTIGGSTASSRNVISGNATDGVSITGSGTDDNVVAGNCIGTNVGGTGRLGNVSAGVNISNGSSSNTIGGTVAAAANVVSANGTQGINIGVGGTASNLVEGNFIGTNAQGSVALGNNSVGILVGDTSSNTIIGGTVAHARNIISGNSGDGVDIVSNSVPLTGVLVEGNFIGTNAQGSAAVPNGGAGVNLGTNASANVIGGTGLARNVISGNTLQGVVMAQGATGNLVEGDYIGTNAAGTAAVPNKSDGVDLGLGTAASGNTVGPDNVIAYNKGVGVNVIGGSGDLITQNSIFANTAQGIQVSSGANNNLSPPSLTSATFSGGQLTLEGTVAGQTSANLTLEIFVAAQGQGKTFLVSVAITTDANGNFTATVTKSFSLGVVLTATVIDGSNNASQFSPATVTVKA